MLQVRLELTTSALLNRYCHISTARWPIAPLERSCHLKDPSSISPRFKIGLQVIQNLKFCLSQKTKENSFSLIARNGSLKVLLEKNTARATWLRLKDSLKKIKCRTFWKENMISQCVSFSFVWSGTHCLSETLREIWFWTRGLVALLAENCVQLIAWCSTNLSSTSKSNTY